MVIRKSLFKLIVPIFFVILLVYGIQNYSRVTITQYADPDSLDVRINFLLPMKQDSLPSKISIIPEVPSTPVSYTIHWLDSSTMVLKLTQKGFPQGQLLTIKINKALTKLPFIKKSFEKELRPQIPVYLISKQELKNVPTHGPIPIVFNTPIEPENLSQFIKLPIPGEIKPKQFSYNGKSYFDYSHWQYFPHKPLKHDTSYQLIIKSGLYSKGGSKLKNSQKLVFITANSPKVLNTNPTDKDDNISLYRDIIINLNQDISKASVKVIDIKNQNVIPGSIEIKDKTVIFKPDYAFLPNRSYKVQLNLVTKNHEPLENHEFSFTTVGMGEKYWLDVKLGEKHTVTVYKGDKKIRHMIASGGRPETPTPIGSFYTKDRGHSFWSPRFGEGATYWIRLVGQILIHSVPRDENWQIKKDEHEKLGLPASHGCIRLEESNAKWVYENIPKGTLVIIHP